MAQLYPVAGSKMYIGLKVAGKSEVSLADFTAQEPYWEEVGGWANAGAVGDTTEIITQNLINQRRTLKAKGTSDAGTMENTFVPMPNDPGQIQMRAAIASGCKPYAFKIEWGAGCEETGTVTFTSEANEPGIVNWPGHGLEVGSPVVFSNAGGALPTGLTAGTTYYVLAAGYTVAAFQVGATPGAAEGIETTGAGTGVHTATGQPVGQTDYFYAFATGGARQGGEANTGQLRAWTLAVTSNIVEV